MPAHPLIAPSLQPSARTSPPAAPKRRLAPAASLLIAAMVGFSAWQLAFARSAPAEPELHFGNAELRRSANGAPQRWRKDSVQVVLDPSLRRLGPHAETSVRRAFATWARDVPALPRVTLSRAAGETDDRVADDREADDREADDRGADDDEGVSVSQQHELLRADLVPDGNNTVSYAAIKIPGHQQDLAITVAYIDPESGSILEVDVILNASRKLDVLEHAPHADRASCQRSARQAACGNAYDLESILAHELGHFFGLGEDPEQPGATMYQCTSACETHKRELASADVTSMHELYTLEEPEAASCSHAPSRPADGSTGLALLAFAGAFQAWRRVHRRTQSAALD